MKTLRSFIIIGLLLLPSSALASDAWYTETANSFINAGYIDAQAFEPGTKATRAEFVELTLLLLGGKVHMPFGDPVFDDVGLQSPYFSTFQEGARSRWLRGIGSCAGDHPCIAAPARTVNRAEAAALIVRAFQLNAADGAPAFEDNLPDQWYTDLIFIASSRCILQGDSPDEPTSSGRKTVRPGDGMTQAEMLLMLARAMQQRTYPDCPGGASAVTLPPAPKDLILIQAPLPMSESSSSSGSTLSSSASSINSDSSSSSTSSSSVTSASSASSVSSSSSPASSSTSSQSSTGTGTQDPSYPDLLARFQRYVSQFSDLIVRARAAPSSSAIELLTVMRTQIDLMNQMYPYVVFAKSRSLTSNEWNEVSALQRRIESGFSGAQ